MFDLKAIKSIPCQDVANKFGIKLEKKHNRLWGRLRNEKESSFSINLKNNLWYDFGSDKGGSVIDLLMELDGISASEAIRELAEEYGIQGQATNDKKWHPLTDSQYKELGIQPERATMNFKIDLTKHSFEKVERWSRKYGMHVTELAKKHPEVYNKMINNIAMDNINKLRNLYYSKLESFRNENMDNLTREFIKTTSKDNAYKINKKIELLENAITIKTSFSHLKVDYDKDFLMENNFNISSKEKSYDVNKIAEDYKKIHQYDKIKHFTKEQKIALCEINNDFYKGSDSLLSYYAIKTIYKALGDKIDKGLANPNLMKMFNTVSKAMEGFREVEKINEINTKHQKQLSKDFQIIN